MITIPQELDNSVYSYMYWSSINIENSAQYKLKEMYEDYDGYGLADIKGRKVIACTNKFGAIGDEIEVTLYSVRDSKGRDVAANRSLIKGSDMPDFFSYLRSGYRDMASRIDAFGVEKAKESEIDGGLDR